jgi:glycosyltransferase involved in cell wall biosynthesis
MESLDSSRPLVSVVISAYNCESYLAQTIDSIVRQNYRPLEIIVVDDGSTDGTRQVCQAYPEIIYHYQRNAGPSSARNTGIRLSKGKYIAFLDSDDLWPEGKLRLQVEMMEKHPDVGLLSGDMRRFSGSEVVVPSMFKNNGFDRNFFGDDFYAIDAYKKILIRGNYIPTGTVIVRRAGFGKVGYFDENLRHSEDVDVWLRFALHYKLAYSQEIWLLRRDHSSNLTRDSESMNLALIKVLRKHEKQYQSYWRQHGIKSDRLISEKYLNVGYMHLDKHRLSQARKYFKKSLSRNFQIKTFFHWCATFLAVPRGEKIRKLRKRGSQLLEI